MPEESALSRVFSEIKRRISRKDTAAFFICLLAVLAVHFYAFTNKLINHDDLCEMFGGVSFLPSGRWLLNPVIKLTGRISAPMLNGIVGSVFLALTILTVARVLGVRSLPGTAAVALCMAAHPTVVCTWAYMFTAPAYFIAMFMAVSGAALIRRPGWRWFAPGAALIGMSMGCYQAYLALAAALCVLALALDLLDGGRERDLRGEIVDCLKCLAGLALGLIIYFVVLKLCLFVTGTELLGYAGIDGMTDVDLKTLVKRVAKAYGYALGFPASTVFGAAHVSFPVFLKASSGVSVLAAAWLVYKNKIWKRPACLCLFLALTAVLPLAMELQFVMADESTVHWLMMYATVMMWLFPAAAAERIALPEKGRWRRGAAVICAAALLAVTAVTGYEGAIITNKVYLEMDLSRQSAQNYLTRLFTRVEEQEGYVPGEKVALIGRASMPAVIPNEHLTGIFTGSELLNIYSRGRLYEYYLGFSSAWVSPQETEGIKATEEFKSMPAYPAGGSVRRINGIITVKLSEE